MNLTIAVFLTLVITMITSYSLHEEVYNERFRIFSYRVVLLRSIGFLLPIMILTAYYSSLVTDNNDAYILIRFSYLAIVMIHFFMLVHSTYTIKEAFIRILITSISIVVFMLLAPYTIGGLHIRVLSLTVPILAVSYSNKAALKILSIIITTTVIGGMIFMSENPYFDGTMMKAAKAYAERYEDVQIINDDRLNTNEKPIGLYALQSNKDVITMVYYKGIIYDTDGDSVNKTSEKILRSLGEIE